MPDQILVAIITEHLPYEIDMLRSTYRQLESVANHLRHSETAEQKMPTDGIQPFASATSAITSENFTVYPPNASKRES